MRLSDLEDGACALRVEGSGVITRPLNLGGHPLSNVGDGVGLNDVVNVKQLAAALATVATLPVAEADLTLNYPTHDNSLDHDGGAQDTAIAGKAPTSHAANASTYGYGDATNAGHLRVGTGLGVTTGTVSVTYGTTAGTSCQGNDARLSDARTPVGTALTSGQLWVGSAGNVAAAVAVSGDVTITNAGVTALKSSLKTGTIYLLPQVAKIRTTGGCGALTSAETATNKQNYYYLPFAKASDSYANWTIVMPDNWDAGTFTATFYWQPSAGTAAQTVRWVCQGYCYTDLEVIDEAWGAAVNSDDATDGTTTKLFQITSTAVTLGGTRGAGKLAIIQVGRLGSADNLNATAWLLGVKLTYGMV